MADQRKLTVVRIDVNERFKPLGLECVACSSHHYNASGPDGPSDWVALTTESGYFTGIVYCPSCANSIGIFK